MFCFWQKDYPKFHRIKCELLFPHFHCPRHFVFFVRQLCFHTNLAKKLNYCCSQMTNKCCQMWNAHFHLCNPGRQTFHSQIKESDWNIPTNRLPLVFMLTSQPIDIFIIIYFHKHCVAQTRLKFPSGVVQLFPVDSVNTAATWSNGTLKEIWFQQQIILKRFIKCNKVIKGLKIWINIVCTTLWSSLLGSAVAVVSRSSVRSVLCLAERRTLCFLEFCWLCNTGRLLRALHLRLCAPVSLQPVLLRLHLGESGQRPLEGEPLLFSTEDGQTARFVLSRHKCAV